MLLLLQIVLAVMFIITLFQVICDFIRGSHLIATGLLLLVVGYSLKFYAWSYRILRCKSANGGVPAARAERKAPTWRIIR
jgi:uncharacterized membrane protein